MKQSNRTRARTALLATAVGLVATLGLAACGNPLEPAQKALAEAEAAVTASANEVVKFAPNRAEELNAKLAELKAALGKGDYAAVVAGAPALLAETKAVAAETAARKQEFFAAINEQWSGLAAQLPQQTAAIESQIAKYEQAARLPAGVTQQAVTDAKAALDTAQQHWGEATKAFAEGRLEQAIALANDVQARAGGIRELLKMPEAPAAAPAAPPAG